MRRARHRADRLAGLTVTGGLPYHGGPASGYLTHSIAAMVERLRADPGAFGMVSGVGMHMTKHVFGIFSTTPPPPGTLTPPDTRSSRIASTCPPPRSSPSTTVPATVLAASVVHGRDGAAEYGVLVCELPDGARTYAQVRDTSRCEDAETNELVGRGVQLRPETVTGPAGEGRVEPRDLVTGRRASDAPIDRPRAYPYLASVHSRECDVGHKKVPAVTRQQMTARRRGRRPAVKQGEIVARRSTSRGLGAVALLLALMLVGAACGGGSSSKGDGESTGSTAAGAGTGSGEKPKVGGKVTIAMEADTTGGFCLSNAQLAAAGIQVARAIYDTLTVPDDKGNYVPFLAKSVTPNADYTVWTIELRDGIKFHDGTALDATVVKDNIDHYTGKTDPKNALFKFSLDAAHWINDVKVVDPTTVEVDLKGPWVSFPSHLYNYGRMGMMAEAQMNAPPGDCGIKTMIGTGPFKFDGDWVTNDHMTLNKNPDYWRKDKDGTKLPYLDQITFKPVVDPTRFANGIKTGDFDLGAHRFRRRDLRPHAVAEEWRDQLHSGRQVPRGDVRDLQHAHRTVRQHQRPQGLRLRGELGRSTTSCASTGSRSGRTARSARTSSDTCRRTSIRPTRSRRRRATRPRPRTTPRSTRPTPARTSRSRISPPRTRSRCSRPSSSRATWTKAGIKMDIKQEEQSQTINDVIGGQYQAAGWRNHPGFDPDDQWVWWHCYSVPAANNADQTNIGEGAGIGNNCDNLVNFTHFNDAAINTAMETGRTSADPAVRKKAYEDLNLEFAKQLWSAWGYYTIWTIPSQTKVQNILGPNLPTADSPDAVGAAPFPGLSSGNDVSGLWLK